MQLGEGMMMEEIKKVSKTSSKVQSSYFQVQRLVKMQLLVKKDIPFNKDGDIRKRGNRLFHPRFHPTQSADTRQIRAGNMDDYEFLFHKMVEMKEPVMPFPDLAYHFGMDQQQIYRIYDEVNNSSEASSRFDKEYQYCLNILYWNFLSG